MSTDTRRAKRHGKRDERLRPSDRWITVGGSQHYRVVPYMPDMAWLGAPPSDRMAARYEVHRGIVLRQHRQELLTEQDALAAELDAGAMGTRRTAIVQRINELHGLVERTRAATGVG